MAQLFAPGVYVKEVSTLGKQVARIGSAVPLFLGITQIDPPAAVKISSMEDYERLLGGPWKIADMGLGGLTDPVFAFLLPKQFFYYSLSLYFANGGGPCWVASVGKNVEAVDTDRFVSALAATEKIEEISLVLFPELPSVMGANHTQVGADDNAKRQTIVRAIIAHCAKMGDRFALFDVFMRPRQAGLFQGDVNDTGAFRTQAGTQNLMFAAAYYPQVEYTLPIPDSAIRLVASGGGDEALVNGKTLAEVLTAAQASSPEGERIAGLMQGVLPKIRKSQAAMRPYIGATPAVAAIIGKVDAQRGEWKAPANVEAVGLNSAVDIWWGYQNDPISDPIGGKDINELRNVSGGGVKIGGARTLAGNDLAYRYIPVKRTLMMIGKSLKAATGFAVFEPNTATTWLKLETMCAQFLNDLWRDGALMGGKPEEAYRVTVGLGKSMTADDVLNGILRVQISVAVVRPAEFIELQFSHVLQANTSR